MMIEAQHTQQAVKPRAWKRVLWMVAIYAGSVMALGVVAMLFRVMMTAAGMKSH
ncbi:DUF2474 domain-containing protein [Erwinia billingiae]|jgi:hypothetical protein|nr:MULTISPECIES: DUF2474 domain-containing protein [Erwinia]MBN7121428.1 hypothetical protein [Erwinia billingiae]QBR50901.1 DUF2474 domain-containing protein [Erwinia sp. QL-Z3]QEW33123.1 DUF2474 domain-containing protein [Erwinia billingiae]